jgi:hypothetical protein
VRRYKRGQRLHALRVRWLTGKEVKLVETLSKGRTERRDKPKLPKP